MKFAKNVIRNSAVLCASASLIVACQDRGGFKARTFTQAERAAWDLKHPATPKVPAGDPAPTGKTASPTDKTPGKVAVPEISADTSGKKPPGSDTKRPHWPRHLFFVRLSSLTIMTNLEFRIRTQVP